jgi:hypothetical protein
LKFKKINENETENIEKKDKGTGAWAKSVPGQPISQTRANPLYALFSLFFCGTSMWGLLLGLTACKRMVGGSPLVHGLRGRVVRIFPLPARTQTEVAIAAPGSPRSSRVVAPNRA